MNVLAEVFGIFRQRGLVSRLKQERSLFGFVIVAVLISLLGATIYGFAMGVGLGLDTAVKDAVKLGLIVALALIFSIPIFWVAYRLLGRREKASHLATVPLTLVTTTAIVLAVAAPIVFLLSVLAGYSDSAVYIHVVLIDVALLVGLYLAGTLAYHSFPDRSKLLIPNTVGFLMFGVILVVLIIFLSPFLQPRQSFSVGTDRLLSALGVGVFDEVNEALVAASSADRVSYRYQTTNSNGDLDRDYTVTRVGNDYLLEIGTHSVPEETALSQRRIWILDGRYFNDFDSGMVNETTYDELAGILDLALPLGAFGLAPEFSGATWRAFEIGDTYTATGTTPPLEQVEVELEAPTRRLSRLTIGTTGPGLGSETKIDSISSAQYARSDLETSLNQAVVIGSVDRSDPSLQDFTQSDTFFVVRYPRTWTVGFWSGSEKQVRFTTLCGAAEGCPMLKVSVLELEEGKGPRQYAEDLGRSLDLQPEYREIKVRSVPLSGATVGEVEYLFDRVVRGEVQTDHHLEYVIEGSSDRYHLDFSAPDSSFEASRGLFEEIARFFNYLGKPQ